MSSPSIKETDTDIPQIILENLQLIDPHSHFYGTPPKITSSSKRVYFTKQGISAEIEQYTGEAESLKAIEAGAPGLAPRVLSFGLSAEGEAFFISQYKDLGHITDVAGKRLAKRLAMELHRHTSVNGFGFHVPTFCGATRLNNGWFERWEDCFTVMIGDLAAQLSKQDVYEDLCRDVAKVRKSVIPKLLGPLQIQPVLLHGDLWSGNVGVEYLTEEPVIFDPSSFYGHNEADLAIARVFGGFPRDFFSVYHAYYPKSEPSEEYDLRGDLYELFHYLNHTLLFGGSYADGARKRLNRLLT